MLSETVRIVPQSVAVSGITLVVEPARILATVTTAGSKASTRRVTIAWRAVTISQAIGIGSPAWWGIDAWPPLPRTVIWNSSADASSGRPAAGDHPRRDRRGLVDGEGHRHGLGAVGRPWRAGRPRACSRAPWWPSSPGWNMKATRPAQRAAPRGEELGGAGEHGDVGVVAARVHGAVVAAGELEPGVLVHRQGVHVAAEQHGGAGLVAVEHRDHRRRRRAGGDGERQAVERLEHHRLRARQLEAELRLLVDPPPQVDGVLQLRPRLVQHPVQHVSRHGADRTPGFCGRSRSHASVSVHRTVVRRSTGRWPR